MHQEKLPNGRWADMGPNWIHGTKDNPILHLAKQTNTDVGAFDDRSNVFGETGNLFPVKEAEEHVGIMWDIIEDAFKHSNKFASEISTQESLHDFFRAQIVQRIPETEQNWEEKRKIVMQISEHWGTFVGSPVYKQSLKFFWLEECIEGGAWTPPRKVAFGIFADSETENLFCAGTFTKILELIAQPAISGADIKFNTKVERILGRTKPEDPIKVQTTKGQGFEFDDVVVTSPLGWLKRHLDAFEPQLPLRLTKAIDAIGYGCLEKVSSPSARDWCAN